MSILNVIVYALIVLISVILVVLILIQPSKGGGFGSAFGGVGENVFGAHAMEHLSKLTVWLISIFFVLALLLTVLSAHAKKQDRSVMKTAVAVQTSEKTPDVKTPDVKTPDVKTPSPAK